VPNKLAGVIFMFLSIIVFFFVNVLEDLLRLSKNNVFLDKKNTMSSIDKVNSMNTPPLHCAIADFDTFIDPKFLSFHKLKF